MPIYEAQCPKCNNIEEVICLYEEYVSCLFTCNECKTQMTKVISTGNFNLKGEGFYKQNSSKWD